VWNTLIAIIFLREQWTQAVVIGVFFIALGTTFSILLQRGVFTSRPIPSSPFLSYQQQLSRFHSVGVFVYVGFTLAYVVLGLFAIAFMKR